MLDLRLFLELTGGGSRFCLDMDYSLSLLSIGMTKKQFRRMISFEALFYAIKSSIYGILLALPLCLLIYQTIGVKFSFGLTDTENRNKTVFLSCFIFCCYAFI